MPPHNKCIIDKGPLFLSIIIFITAAKLIKGRNRGEEPGFYASITKSETTVSEQAIKELIRGRDMGHSKWETI